MSDIIDQTRSIPAISSLIRGFDRAIGELCGSYNNAKPGTREFRRKMQRKLDDLKLEIK
jgi:hypothetical protein